MGMLKNFCVFVDAIKLRRLKEEIFDYFFGEVISVINTY